MLKAKDYVYLVLAVILGLGTITGFAIKDEYDNEFSASEAYRAARDLPASEALPVLLEIKRHGRQKKTFQIHISNKIAQSLKQLGRMPEAVPFFEEVIEMDPKLIGNILFSLDYSSLKNEAVFELAQFFSAQDDCKRALELMRIVEEEWLYPSCGLGLFETRTRILDMRLRCALREGEMDKALQLLREDLFQENLFYEHRQSLIKQIKRNYSPEEIKIELHKLRANLREVDLREDADDLPNFEFRSTFFGEEIIVLGSYWFQWSFWESTLDGCENRQAPLARSACRMEYAYEYIRCSEVFQELGK